MDTQLSLEDFLKEEPIKAPPAKTSVVLQEPKAKETTALETTAASAVKIQNNDSLKKDEDDSSSQEEDVAIFTVSELNSAIKEQVESKFTFVWLKGEISNFKPHTSGHFYFSLKDDKSQISAVMFKGFNRLVKFKPHDGMEVIVRGKITVYEPRGSYQIYCEVMEPVGVGALQIAYEQLKTKLQAEGLFDVQRKRPLPALAQRVAIVTSPTGAAIRDMLNVLNRRMKNLEVTIFPCAVQGEKAPQEIVNAIELANKIGSFDVMIVGRGGGSIEDLWAFNEEKVVRAIAASKIPTVSAVGHEVDFTIADFVADLRAPTPSAAAELISKNTTELVDRIQFFSKSLGFSITKKIESQKQKLITFQKQLVDPKRKLQDLSIRCDELSERLSAATVQFFVKQNMRLGLISQKIKSPQNLILQMQTKIETLKTHLNVRLRNSLNKKTDNLEKSAAVLDSLSPLRVLGRGYSIVKNKKGEILKSTKQVKAGAEILVQVSDGRLSAKVETIDPK